MEVVEEKIETQGKILNIMNATDPKCQFIVGTNGIKDDMDTLKRQNNLIDINKVDYIVQPEPKEDEPLPETRKTLSYFQVKTINEGMDWYRNLDPKIPDCLLKPMAKWSFGDLSKLTKKDIKNMNKKNKKKNKKKQDIIDIKIDNTPQIISFD